MPRKKPSTGPSNAEMWAVLIIGTALTVLGLIACEIISKIP